MKMDTGEGMMEGARNGRRLGLRLVRQSPQLSLTWTPTGTTKCGHEHARENLESYGVLRSARRRSVMEILHRRCAGLDVHKDTVMACVLIRESASGRKRKELREFGTMTQDLLQLADWLRDCGVTHLAMEATGVYWKPVWNVLEGEFKVLLVNAQHIKRVPGRKTDVKDCEWIAELLQHGLVQASFVPPVEVRELRDLTRYRATLVGERARVANRMEKVLEDANLKLASVVTDILGISERAILEAIVRGEEDPERLAEMARCRLRAKLPALREALRGRVTEHHRFLLGRLLAHVRFVEAEITELEGRIAEQMRPFEKEVEQWVSIPGINEVAAWSLIAELGPRLEAFSSEQHLSSWAGMCPGSNESAGKRRTGKTRKGNPWVRRMLCQIGWGAARSQGTYLSAKYHRIAARRGKKRAIIAVAHNVLVIGFHLIRNQRRYNELGPDYFDQLHRHRLERYLVRRLEALGNQVVIEPLHA